MTFSAASPSSETLFDIAGKQKQLDELTVKMGMPGFWDNQEKAQQVIGQTKPLNAVLRPYLDLEKGGEDLRVLCELSEEDESLEAEVEPTLAKLEKKLAEIELQSMFDGPA